MKYCILLLTGALAFGAPADWHDLSANIPNQGANLVDIHAIGSEVWICADNVPEVYHTTDGGETFETRSVTAPCLALHMCDRMTGYAGGFGGSILRTVDGGVNWTFHGAVGADVKSIHFPPDSDTGYVCGFAGAIARLTPSSVERIESGVVGELTSIYFPLSAAEGWVCGGSEIRHFVDSIWLDDQSFPTGFYNALDFHDDRFGWAVGDSGKLIRTADGLSWGTMPNPDPQLRSLNGVSFHDGVHGWAVGDGGVVLSTIDNGQVWRVVADGLTTANLHATHAVDTNRVYVTGAGATLLRYGVAGGIEENGGVGYRRTPEPAIVRGALFLSGESPASLHDVNGRRLLTLTPGANDIQHIRAGVYFVLRESDGSTQRVVIAK